MFNILHFEELHSLTILLESYMYDDLPLWPQYGFLA